MSLFYIILILISSCSFGSLHFAGSWLGPRVCARAHLQEAWVQVSQLSQRYHTVQLSPNPATQRAHDIDPWANKLGFS